MAQYRFHSDPSHGWLAVPVAKLVALGIADKISTFSYRNTRNVAFLEEDCDAAIFFAALKANKETYKIIFMPTAIKDSRIRTFNSFYL